MVYDNVYPGTLTLVRKSRLYIFVCYDLVSSPLLRFR